MTVVGVNLLLVAFNVILPPFVTVLCVILALASFGKSIGIRKLYVRTLLQVFEWVRKSHVAAAEKKDIERQSIFDLARDDDDEERDSDSATASFDDSGGRSDIPGTLTGSSTVKTAADDDDADKRKAKLAKFGKESVHNVISRRDNLMLIPHPPAAAAAPPPLNVPRAEADAAAVESHAAAAAQAALDDAADDDAKAAASEALPQKILSGRQVSVTTFKNEFALGDVLDYVKTGIASVIEDEVTQRFEAEELKSWNLLTRTSQSFEFVSVKLSVIWLCGFVVRYFILLPGRICILFVGLLWMGVCMWAVGHLPDGARKSWWHYHVFTSCFQVLAGSLSAVITYHDPPNKPRGGICVANHTSPIDVLILACDNAYALTAQRHDGFLGRCQKMLSKGSHNVWFERQETKDRSQFRQRLKEHVEDPTKLPILIFPEGTCINNTSVMQFKKGSFEVGGLIYPVAIKYDPKFGDAFWNSSKNGMMSYIFLMMSSWAIVCDVWYLPPMERRPNEDGVAFANRVKSEIARKGGLVDLMWDGNLKRESAKPRDKERQQEEFAKRLKVE